MSFQVESVISLLIKQAADTSIILLDNNKNVKTEISDINFYLRTGVTTLPFGPRRTRPPLERKSEDAVI